MILSLDTQRDIRNAALSALHYIAFDQHCEVSDILALLSTTSHTSISGPNTAPTVVLSTTPSQPDPKQAAPSAATAPGGVHAEVSPASDTSETGGEEPSILPATPSPELQPTSTPAVQAQNVEPTSEVLDGPSLSPPGAERAVDPGPSLPPRGRPETTRAQVVAVHHAHPEWPSKLIAEHLSITEDSVRATASRKKLKLVSWWDYQRAEAAKKAAGIIAPARTETPPAVAAEPAIVSPAKAKKPTLGDRIVAVRAEHPDWPYRVVAKHLGAPKNSVQAYASVLGFIWPSQAEYDDAEAAKILPANEPIARRKKLADMIRAHLADHPDATLKDLSDALGVKQTSIGWAAKKAGIVLRKYTAEERSAATSKGIQAKALTQPAGVAIEGGDIPRPSKPAIDAENEPLDAPRVIKRPKGQRICLRQKLGAGKYLHMGGEGLVDSKVYAWIGTTAQLGPLRAKFPDTAGMVEEVVEA